MYVLSARQSEGFPRGYLSLSDPQRTWASISLQDSVNVRIYDPFSEGGGQAYLSSVDVEVGFAGRKSTTEQLDQEELAAYFTKVSCYSRSRRVRQTTDNRRITRISFLHLDKG